MSRIAVALTLLATASFLPIATRADTIDDFVLVGDGNTITFSLPSSPPGNLSTCPVGGPISCLPGSQTAFYLSAPVVINGVTEMGSFSFPTDRFGGGLRLSPLPGVLQGPQLFAPDAASPTFLPGVYTLDPFPAIGGPPFTTYTLTIASDPSTAATPEPSTLAMFTTGVLGFIGLTRSRFRPRPQ